MEDLELIEKYLRKELSPDEVTRFNARLAGDAGFKKLFETETLVHKALLFSREKERMRTYAVKPATVTAAYTQWLDNRTLLSLGATAVAVWIFSTFSSSLTSLSPEYIKWVGLMVAVGTSILLLALRNRTINLRLAASGLFNGLLVFVLASGFDAINQGADAITGKGVNEAYLIPFTADKPWWPTQSLEDSLEANRKKMKELRDHIRDMVASRLNAGLHLNFGPASKFTPVVVPRSSTVSSGATYEADLFLATSPVGQNFEMFVDGKPITMEADPSGVLRGKVSFTASADRFDNAGVAKKKFVAEIELGDSTYARTVEYNVMKLR